MKLIIAGSRHFHDYHFISKEFDVWVTENGYPEEIISGAARGVDSVGEAIGHQLNIPVKRFPADWNRYGKAAGPIRNKQMAEYADALLAFLYDGSRGTANMIRHAMIYHLHVTVVEIPT